MVNAPVYRAATSAQMRYLMRLVVERGTGRNARVPGYLVGGKTGTADKLGKNGRPHRVRLVGVASLANRGHVVDIDSKFGHQTNRTT